MSGVTERLFDKDSYLKEFEAMVLVCEPEADGVWQIVLDRTAFFPEGGGQAGDTGWLEDCRVLDTREKEGVIYHKTNKPLEAGRIAGGKIDFGVRFDKMQQHTGEHILSGIVCSTYGYHNVGFHLGEEFTTLDFDGELSPEQIEALENEANEKIYENLPIQVLYPTKEEEKQLEYRSKIEIAGQARVVEIPGVDNCACCAPHVGTTAEIGVIKILSCDRHRGGCRLTIVCGKRALRDYQMKQKSAGEIAVALSTKIDKAPAAVAGLQTQIGELKEQLKRVQALYLQGKLEAVKPEDSYVCIFEENLDSVSMRNFVNEAMERCGGICGAFMGNDTKGYNYILGSKTLDVREFSKVLNGEFSGKGGGKPPMIQGSLIGTKAKISSFFAQNPGKTDILSRE